MTREEAIKILKKLYQQTDVTDEYGDIEDMQPYEEAVDMAIKALDNSNLVNVSQDLVNDLVKDLVKEDAISRQAAIRIAEQGQVQGFEWQFKELIKLPPVTCSEKPNRSGEWLHQQLIPDDITGHMHGECSCCHKVRIVDNFCPNCGAKMVEPQESEDSAKIDCSKTKCENCNNHNYCDYEP